MQFRFSCEIGDWCFLFRFLFRRLRRSKGISRESGHFPLVRWMNRDTETEFSRSDIKSTADSSDNPDVCLQVRHHAEAFYCLNKIRRMAQAFSLSRGVIVPWEYPSNNQSSQSFTRES